MEKRKYHLILFIALICFASQINAQLVWDGTSSPWTHGTGTASDPYLIETPQNLSWLSDMVNNGVSNYSGVYFKQTADFNMNGNSYGFNVIGDNSSSHYFSGHYDGDFNSISNLKISNVSDCIGLFGYTINASLKGVSVKGIKGTGTSVYKKYVGSIIANSLKDTLINCSCSGNIEITENVSSQTTPSYTYVGGLIGYSVSSVSVNCFVSGDVRATRNYYNYFYVGGLFGEITASYDASYMGGNQPLISQAKCCYFKGQVYINGSSYWYAYSQTIRSSYYGMLAGDCDNSACVLQNCYSVGTFSVVSSSYIQSNDVLIGLQNGAVTNNNQYSGTSVSTTSSFGTYRADSYMKSIAMPILLNSGLDSTVYYYDSLNVNSGYPIFGYQRPIKYFVNATCDVDKGSVSRAGRYASGSTVSLRAMPAEGYIFSGWSDGTTANPRTVTVTSDTTYTANFTKNAYNVYVKQDCTVNVE